MPRCRPAPRFRRRQAWCLLLVATLTAAGCNEFFVPAPVGTTLTIQVESSTIAVLGGQTGVTVRAFKSDGTAVLDGTSIFFATTLGSIAERVETSGGAARATLHSDGQSGTATVTATIGVAGGDSGTTTAQIDVVIGIAVSSIVVTADPTTLAAGGGKTRIVALALGAAGEPLGGVPVTFTTTAGGFDTPSPVNTAAGGRARLSLTTAQNAVVTATSGSATGNVQITVAGTRKR